MEKLLTVLFVTILFSSCQRQIVPNPVSSSLDWLIGTWEGDYRKGKFVETWTRLNSHTLNGEGDYIVAGKSVMKESLHIHTMDTYLGYLASINGGSPVMFVTDQSHNNRWVFENREHDFPQRIIYERKGNNQVYIRAEGFMGEKEIVDEYILNKQN